LRSRVAFRQIAARVAPMTTPRWNEVMKFRERLLHALRPAPSEAPPDTAPPNPAPPNPPPGGIERRGAVRYDTDRAVAVRRWGGAAVKGRLLNISRTGAAIRLDPGFRIAPGNDVLVSGLLDAPITAWVVACDQNLLRLRFAQDEATRAVLRDVIRDWFGVAE
jgi:hypothetical protein